MRESPMSMRRIGNGMAGLLSVLAFMAASPGAAEDEASHLLEDAMTATQDAPVGFGRGSLIVAPIPLKSPALGNGLIAAGGYLFTFDAGSDTSFIGAAAMRTSNGSEGAAVATNLNFADGRWSVQAMAGRARVNYALYGFSGLTFGPVPLSQEGTFLRLGLERGLSDRVSVGIEAQVLDTTLRVSPGNAFPLPNLPGFGIGVTQALIGPTFTFDTRDDTIYPTRGVQASLLIQRGFGLGRFDNRFDRGTFEIAVYAPLGEKGVLALGATACRASGEAPFFNLCSVGLTDALRGFPAGQYLDNALLSAQAELRHRLGGRFGVVAFAGASRTGAGFRDLGPTVSAGGVGLRVRLSRSFPLDFSIDQTVNDAGDSYTYVYIGQSF
ncbi:MAG: hypothetical protein EP307_11155 [Rhodobacteraceae bacterium]|nr:MAG: hypothetical protein EP307_11155 [Paracoccaceae bacterium]